MRALIAIIFLLVSCVPEQKTTSAPINPGSPSRWNVNSFPVKLKLANDFTVFEKDNLTDAGISWSDSISNSLTFFDTTENTDLSYHSSLSAYLDNEMGIYKAQVWPGELPGSALAITQVFGYRKYLGTANEHVEIFHADILLNDVTYNFSATFDPGTYDLQTVIIHELGHFLGLQHENDPFVDTVMYPSVTKSTIYRSPYSHDSDMIADLYSLGGAAAALLARDSGHSVLPPQHELPEDVGPIEPIVIQTELYPDGSCIHFENGHMTYRH